MRGLDALQYMRSEGICDCLASIGKRGWVPNAKDDAEQMDMLLT